MKVNSETIDSYLYEVYIDGIYINNAFEADDVKGYIDVSFDKITNEYPPELPTRKRIYGRVLIIKNEEKVIESNYI